MGSLFDDLSEKLRQDLRLTKRGDARFDMSLLLFTPGSQSSLHSTAAFFLIPASP